MTAATGTLRGAAVGGNPGAAAALAVAVALLGGWLLLGLRAARPEEMAPAAFLAAPRLVLAHLPEALAGAVPDWLGISLAGVATGTMLFAIAAGARLMLMAAGRQHGLLAAALAAVGAVVAPLLAPAGGPGAAVATPLAVVLAAVAVTGVERSAGRFAALIAALAVLFAVGRFWPSGLPAPVWPAAIPGTLGWPGQSGPQVQLLAVGAGLVAAAGLWRALHASRAGLILRAGQDDPRMVAALGHGAAGPGLAAIAAGLALAMLGATLGAPGPGTSGAGADLALLAMVLATGVVAGGGPVGGCLPAGVLVGLAGAYGAAVAAPPLAWGPVGVLVLAGLARRRD